MPTHAFREAVELRDHEAMVATLASDIRFNSPVSHRPFVGRDAVAVVLGAVLEVFEDFRYTDQFESGDCVALVFEARVGDREVQGVDLLRHDASGLVSELTALVRPLTGLLALGEAMGPRVADLQKGPA